jgi:hypothetical protein
MVNFCAVCGCCTRTDIVREHLENTLRICDVSAMGLYSNSILMFINFPKRSTCKCHARWSESTYINIASYINIPYQSETFGGEDFELCYIFSIFFGIEYFPTYRRAWNNIQLLAGKCPTKVKLDWKLPNLVSHFFISF